MVCRQCGTAIADKAIVCFKCGAATAVPEARPSNRLGAARRSTVPAWIWALIAAAVLAGVWWRFY